MSLIRGALTVLVVVLSLVVAAPAVAHEEREVEFPDGSGSVPAYRSTAPDLLVCKTDRADFDQRIAEFPAELKRRNLLLFERCQKDGFRHLQEAVDAADKPGMNIAILPGVYLEEPTQAEPAGECAELDAPTSDLGYQVLSWEQQVQCPNNDNLVAILGKEDLQIEGTGASRNDVIIDGQYRKLNVIRADMANGIYFKNFTVQRSAFNSLYILATDGFVIDDVLGRWNDEYGFLTFASDHGLYTDCEAYGNGDSGLYPGSASDINRDREYDVTRYAIEITGCRSHHNMVGYSGTAGNSVWVHDNEFDHNMGGAAMDSAFPDHPGLPQDHGKFERNLIHDNNEDYYRYVRDGTCYKPSPERGYEQGVVCPQIPVPVGTGVIIAGGNYNLFQDNWVYGHERAAFFLHSVPAFIRKETSLGKQFDTSHHNRFVDNHLGKDQEGKNRPNRIDVWWDGQGRGNCWSGVGASNPRVLPSCGDAPDEVSGGSARLLMEPAKVANLMVCAEYRLSTRNIPAGCDWFGASGVRRLEVQLAAAVAGVLALVGTMLWLRRLRRHRGAALALVAGLAGLALTVAGATTALAHTLVPAAGLLLMGVWLVVTGVLLRGERRAFGWTTVLLGGFTLLDAMEKSLVLIPWTPLSAAWLRTLLGVVWVFWAVVVSARTPQPDDLAEPDPEQVVAPA